jgi:hypothetical protein
MGTRDTQLDTSISNGQQQLGTAGTNAIIQIGQAGQRAAHRHRPPNRQLPNQHRLIRIVPAPPKLTQRDHGMNTTDNPVGHLVSVNDDSPSTSEAD